MFLIVGLGNPEAEYGNTRHNMGFKVVNEIAKKYDIDMNRTKFNAIYGNGTIKGEKVIIIKPQTYMNLSGKAVAEYANFYKIEKENILVIYDDIDLEPGTIRLRKKGSAGTHNGMKSVVECLATTGFPRIRVGIGQPEHKGDLINYVIGNLTKEESEILETGIKTAANATVEIVENGIDNAMNKFN